MHAGARVRPVMVPLFYQQMTVLLLLLARPAAGWISISQAKYGTQIEDMVKASYGLSRASAFRSLGWLWTYPRDSLDTKGLGGSITWALDPKMSGDTLGLLLPTLFVIIGAQLKQVAGVPEYVSGAVGITTKLIATGLVALYWLPDFTAGLK